MKKGKKDGIAQWKRLLGEQGLRLQLGKKEQVGQLEIIAFGSLFI